MSKPYDNLVRRAALPEVLFTSDVALALESPAEEAETALLSGRLGRHFTVAGRPAILRDEFLRSLGRQEGREVLRGEAR